MWTEAHMYSVGSVDSTEVLMKATSTPVVSLRRRSESAMSDFVKTLRVLEDISLAQRE